MGMWQLDKEFKTTALNGFKADAQTFGRALIKEHFQS
jgi:hypothetical protein